VIQFYNPVTVIVGVNGSGKTVSLARQVWLAAGVLDAWCGQDKTKLMMAGVMFPPFSLLSFQDDH
jgi:predicted ATPase